MWTFADLPGDGRCIWRCFAELAVAGGGRIVIVRDAFNDCRISSAQENITRFDEGQGTVLCLAKYEYDAWGNQFWWEVNRDSDFDVNIASINPLRYRGYVYDRHTGLYYLQSRYYNPEWGRFINADSQLNADTPIELNLFAYCNNNPVNFVDHSGHSATAIVLSVIAVAGLLATAFGVATDNNILTAVGLTAVAIPAMISGGMAIGLLTPIGIAVGSTTVFAGTGTALFASAEYQEAFTGNNWMLDAGMSEGAYNALMITTAIIATGGTIVSGVTSSFRINSFPSLGRFGKYGKPGYPGMKFTTVSGKTRVLSFHTHSHVKGKMISQCHWQLQKWNPSADEVGGSIGQWLWWNLRRL